MNWPHKDAELSKEIKKLSRHDGLIIDEMGYVQQSREEMEVLCYRSDTNVAAYC